MNAIPASNDSQDLTELNAWLETRNTEQRVE